MLARKLTAAVVLCAVGLSACGSSSKSAGSTSPTTPGTSGSKSSGGGGSFCALMRKDAGAFKGADINTKSPEDLKAVYAKVVPEIERAQSEAPDAIKSDIGTLATSLKTLVKALEAADYDVTKLNFDSLKALADPKFAAASHNVSTYLEKNCGIKAG